MLLIVVTGWNADNGFDTCSGRTDESGFNVGVAGELLLDELHLVGWQLVNVDLQAATVFDQCLRFTSSFWECSRSRECWKTFLNSINSFG